MLHFAALYLYFTHIMNEKINCLRNFLEKLDVIRKKYEDIEAQKDLFNVFSAMFNTSDEVNLHSQFIYSLLNFKTANEYYYLDTFLRTIDSKFKYSRDSLEIHKELHDIDILLIDKTTKNAVIVENKIYASDSNHPDEGQLEKYYRIVIEDEKIPEDSIEVFYLSLDGHKPSSESTSTSMKYTKLCEKVQCISYPNEIRNWLQSCMRFVYDKPFQRETILQYIKLIDDMTNNVDIEEQIEIKKLIGESKGNMESAKLLIDNVNHLHWHTIADFWNGLADALEKHGYEVTQKPTDENYDDIVSNNSRKKKNTALTIICNTSNLFNITIEEDYEDDGWCYFGVEKEKNIPKQYVQVFKTLVANNNHYENNEDWVIWRYSSIHDTDKDFNSWDIYNDATFNLIDDNYRQRITSEIINDIDKFIKDVENLIAKDSAKN